MFKLRDYQALGHEQIVDRFKKNLKTLLVMPTGAGKSKTVVSFMAKYQKHYHIVLVVKTRKLVDQLGEDAKFFSLDYGVFMANHDDFDPSKNSQVCSIDTISTRGIHPHINSKKGIILVIDEADQATSSTYQSMINRYMNRTAGKTFLLGMTATPYNGLDFFDCFIVPITANELRKRGILVDYQYVIPRKSLDYSGISLKRGEWISSQVSSKMNTPSMIKSNFEDWLEFGDNRQTLVFCSDKKHALALMEYINNYYQKEMACFVNEKTKDDERKRIFDRFENGEIRFLINIRIITRGVDIPCIGTILDLASTLNINLHIQKLGRGSRQNPFYKDCIVIDPVKNCINNGPFYKEREISLEKPPKRKKSDLDDISMRDCAKCFRADLVENFKNNVCPFCGFNNSPLPKKKISKAQEKKMFLESASEEQIEQINMINEFKKELWKKKNLGKTRYRNDIAREKAQETMFKKYGYEKLMKIKKSIGLKQETIDKFRRRHEYTPLGGL